MIGSREIHPAADRSRVFLIRLAPADAVLFRYLLEGAGGHLAMLTVLDPASALVKLLFSSDQETELRRFLSFVETLFPIAVSDGFG